MRDRSIWTGEPPIPESDPPAGAYPRSMGVDRCICHDIAFARLKEIADRHGHGLDELARITGCSTNCGMCKPYIIWMLETGQTLFPVISEPAAREIIARWEAARAKTQADEDRRSDPAS